MLRKEFQWLPLWQIRSLLRTPEALTVYTAFFHTLDHCQLPKETASDSTLIGMQCDHPHSNPRQSCELSPGEEDSYLLLYHIFKNFESSVVLSLPLCVCAQACLRPPTFHLPLPFSLNSSINLWCNIRAPHQDGKNELQRSNWVERIKKMTSLQTWTWQKMIFSSAPLCYQPGTLNSPWPLHAVPASYLLITVCLMSLFITPSSPCVCVCVRACICVLHFCTF